MDFIDIKNSQAAIELKNNNRAFKIFIIKNNNFFKFIVDRFIRANYIDLSHRDDMMQEAYMAFYRSLDKFNSDKGSFIAYAHQSIRNALIRYEEKNIRRGRSLENDGFEKICEKESWRIYLAAQKIKPRERSWIENINRDFNSVGNCAWNAGR